MGFVKKLEDTTMKVFLIGIFVVCFVLPALAWVL